MTPSFLGYVVLGYAAFSSDAVLSLLRLVSGQWRDAWLVLVDAGIWLALVTSGYGLVVERLWSRSAVLAATAAGIAVRAIAIVVLIGLKAPAAGVIGVAGAVVPLGVLLVFARRLPPPAAWPVREPAGARPRPAVTARVDLAYGCFAFIAFVLCAVPVASLVPVDFTSSQVIGMLVGIPVALATLAAGAAAIILSIIEWRAWPLLVMSALIASLLALFLAFEDWQVVSGSVAVIHYAVSTAIVVMFCVRWFAFGRRRAALNA